MNKLTKKFLVGVGAILVFTLILSIGMNLYLVERYYVFQKKREMERIGTTLEEMLFEGEKQGRSGDLVIRELEEMEEVAIVRLDPQSDLDMLNESLREDFREKGIGFQKFWLWDQDYLSAQKKGRQLRIYNQGKLNYSLMVEYMQLDSGFYAVAMIIPDISDAIRIINACTTVIAGGTLALACLLIIILVRRIIGPLNQLKQFADQISNHSFQPLKIQTGDELEAVADSMNLMGERIGKYQSQLETRNKVMEELLDDVAHELKTPVSLIGVYAQGIKDGMDDGSFLDTILLKNKQMGELIGHLLTLSRMGQQVLEGKQVDVRAVICGVIAEQEPFATPRDLEFFTDLAGEALILGDQDAVYRIISNLISNGVKYSATPQVWVRLRECGEGFLLEVENRVLHPLDLERVWDAFYVGEESRNKALSGTGLGLPIVKKCAEQWGYPIAAVKAEDRVIFSVIFGKI